MADKRINQQHFDVRTMQRHLTRGVTSQKDINAFLKNLPDLADQADVCEASTEEKAAQNGASSSSGAE